MRVSGLIITDEPRNPGDFLGTDSAGNLSAIARMILTLRQGGVDEIVLVCREENKALEKEVAFLGITRLDLTEQGGASQLTILKKGLEFLQPNWDKVVLASMSVPLFQAETVKKLLRGSASLVLPLFQEEKGLPVVLAQSAMEQVLSSAHTTSFWNLLDSLGETEIISVDDVGVVVRNPADSRCPEALKRHSLQALRPEIKVRLAREKPFLGPGTSQLLSLIEPAGSVRDACAKMGISYSKGWHMLGLMEEQLGEQVVQRQQGGRRGGSAVLTATGKQLLQQFLVYEKACQTAAEALFDDYFQGFI